MDLQCSVSAWNLNCESWTTHLIVQFGVFFASLLYPLLSSRLTPFLCDFLEPCKPPHQFPPACLWQYSSCVDVFLLSSIPPT
jgi:hypothetical protein